MLLAIDNETFALGYVMDGYERWQDMFQVASLSIVRMSTYSVADWFMLFPG